MTAGPVEASPFHITIVQTCRAVFVQVCVDEAAHPNHTSHFFVVHESDLVNHVLQCAYATEAFSALAK
jgi:hypothetical protein